MNICLLWCAFASLGELLPPLVNVCHFWWMFASFSECLPPLVNVCLLWWTLCLLCWTFASFGVFFPSFVTPYTVQFMKYFMNFSLLQEYSNYDWHLSHETSSRIVIHLMLYWVLYVLYTAQICPSTKNLTSSSFFYHNYSLLVLYCDEVWGVTWNISSFKAWHTGGTALQLSTVHCNRMQCSKVHWCEVQFSAVQFNTG